MSKPVKLTIEGDSGVFVIEFSRTEESLVLRDPTGKEKKIEGDRAGVVAQKAVDLITWCAFVNEVTL